MPDEPPADLSTTSPGWEFRLSLTLLRAGLARVRLRHRQAVESIPSCAIALDRVPSLALAKRLLDHLIGWIQRMTLFFPHELQAAWGPPGCPGDADAIMRACHRILQHMEELIAWETTAAQAVPTPDCAKVFERLRGCTGYYIDQLERLLETIDVAVQTGTGTHSCSLEFGTPPSLHGLEHDIARAG